MWVTLFTRKLKKKLKDLNNLFYKDANKLACTAYTTWGESGWTFFQAVISGHRSLSPLLDSYWLNMQIGRTCFILCRPTYADLRVSITEAL